MEKILVAIDANQIVCFTLEPEPGFRDIIHLSGVGLGENIVQGDCNTR